MFWVFCRWYKWRQNSICITNKSIVKSLIFEINVGMRNMRVGYKWLLEGSVPLMIVASESLNWQNSLILFPVRNEVPYEAVQQIHKGNLFNLQFQITHNYSTLILPFLYYLISWLPWIQVAYLILLCDGLRYVLTMTSHVRGVCLRLTVLKETRSKLFTNWFVAFNILCHIVTSKPNL